MSNYSEQYDDNELAQIDDFMAPALQTLNKPVRIGLPEMASTVVVPDASGGSSPYSLELTPFLREPMEAYTDRSVRRIVFMSGQRVGKTMGLVVMPVIHSLTGQPGDIGILVPSQESASRLSSQDIGRVLLHNNLDKRQVAGGMFSRRWNTGTFLTTLWCTEQQVRGLTVRTVICSEVDSYPPPPDDKASWVALASKRVQTAGSLGKIIIEGSPSATISVEDENLDAFVAGLHGTYPTTTASVANSYEEGDKRRWYWTCPHCEDDFEATFHTCVKWDDSKPTIRSKAATAHIVCPNCGSVLADRKSLNDHGKWVTAAQAQGLDEPPNPTRSYWLNGLASLFIPVEDLVAGWLSANESLAKTGNELPLRVFMNSDLGEQYVRPEAARIGGKRLSVVEGRFPRWEVPDEVRCLIATIDTQKRSWAVCYFGLLPNRQICVIGREDLTDIDGVPARPFDHSELWPLMFQKVMQRQLMTESGVQIPIQRVVIDSGGGGGELGETSATQNAYALWKRIKSETGVSNSDMPLVLTKGSRKTASVYELAKDASRKNGAPLWLIGHTVTGDMVVNGLTRDTDGPGRLYFHHGFSTDLLAEMQAERKTPSGYFERIGRARNEQFDLTRMAYACYDMLRLDHIDWANPPAHLMPAGDRKAGDMKKD
jgi:phage terminase large subunit GpA-like protein